MILLIALNCWSFFWLLLYNLNSLLLAGTDDDGDLPSSSMNDRDMRGSGHTSGNGRATIPASSHARAQPDLEAKIHQLEHGLLYIYNLIMLLFGVWL